METILIGLKNTKARKLLKDLEDLDMIEVLEEGNEVVKKYGQKISALKNQIQSPMSEQEIDKQLLSIRKEWQRDI